MKNGQKKNVKLQIRKWNKNIVQFEEVVKESYSSKTLNHEILTLKMEKIWEYHNDWTWKKRYKLCHMGNMAINYLCYRRLHNIQEEKEAGSCSPSEELKDEVIKKKWCKAVFF